VLDSAHVGDIEGALGRISVSETGSGGTLKRRALTLLAIVGPGLIVMVGDNDAGGVATYSQAGQNYGYSLLWVLLLLIPVLVVNQEMVVRLGAVTGVGHARLINERFGRGWGWFSVGDLFVLNFLTIVTEFIGVSLAASYLGVSRYIVVPTAAVALVAIMASGSFRRWERAMFVFIAITLIQIPMLFLSHPQWGQAARDFVIPGIRGGPAHVGEQPSLIGSLRGPPPDGPTRFPVTVCPETCPRPSRPPPCWWFRGRSDADFGSHADGLGGGEAEVVDGVRGVVGDGQEEPFLPGRHGVLR